MYAAKDAGNHIFCSRTNVRTILAIFIRFKYQFKCPCECAEPILHGHVKGVCVTPFMYNRIYIASETKQGGQDLEAFSRIKCKKRAKHMRTHPRLLMGIKAYNKSSLVRISKFSMDAHNAHLLNHTL